ncbi:Low-density lipoprotein receptor repeat class B, partial [Teladorsagia circumcincta]
NIFITAVSLEESINNAVPGARKKRMSEAIHNTNTGSVYVALSDGRYLKKIISGHLQMPSAIVTLPSVGRICYADAGLHAKIECADMDGTHREIIVKDLVFSPSSMAVDEGKGNRIYWADPKYKKVDSVNPDGELIIYFKARTDRTTIVRDPNVPWAIDVFENHLYWVSRETKTLYVQDKFGRGR